MKPTTLIAIVAPALLASPVIAAPARPASVAAAPRPTITDLAERALNPPWLWPKSTLTPADLPEASPTSTPWNAEWGLIEKLEARRAGPHHSTVVNDNDGDDGDDGGPEAAVVARSGPHPEKVDPRVSRCIAEYRSHFRWNGPLIGVSPYPSFQEMEKEMREFKACLDRAHVVIKPTTTQKHLVSTHSEAPAHEPVADSINYIEKNEASNDQVANIKKRTEHSINLEDLRINDTNGLLSPCAENCQNPFESCCGRPPAIFSPHFDPDLHNHKYHETIDTQLEKCVQEDVCDKSILSKWKKCAAEDGMEHVKECRQKLFPKVIAGLRKCKARGGCPTASNFDCLQLEDYLANYTHSCDRGGSDCSAQNIKLLKKVWKQSCVKQPRGNVQDLRHPENPIIEPGIIEPAIDNDPTIHPWMNEGQDEDFAKRSAELKVEPICNGINCLHEKPTFEPQCSGLDCRDSEPRFRPDLVCEDINGCPEVQEHNTEPKLEARCDACVKKPLPYWATVCSSDDGCGIPRPPRIPDPPPELLNSTTTSTPLLKERCHKKGGC